MSLTNRARVPLIRFRNQMLQNIQRDDEPQSGHVQTKMVSYINMYVFGFNIQFSILNVKVLTTCNLQG